MNVFVFFFSWGLLAAHAAAAEAPPRSSPPAPLGLDWCLETAAAANPTLARSLAESDAAGQRIGPAGAWEDPRVRYEASNVPVGDFDFESTPLSGHQLGLQQKLPFPGLLSARRDAARSGADAAALSLEDRRFQVAAQVERAWAELGFAQRALEITARNTALLRQLVQIAEARYRVGTGRQQDVLRAQVELTALLEERLAREAAIDTAEAELARLLDLPDATLPRTASLEDEAAIPGLEALLRGFEERSPRLRELDARVEESRRRVRTAELEGYPDFDLGVGYRLRERVTGDPVDGDDFVGAGLTVRLPVNRGKWRARIAEHSALLRAAEASRREVRASLAARLRTAHAALVRADAETALLATGLVPQARQSLASSRSAYQVGRIDFLSLLDSQVRLQNSELRLVRAQADRREAFAALEATAGEVLR